MTDTAWPHLYAAQGWPVFPCRGKVPITTRGLLDATTDHAQIAAWWQEHPTANVAVRCTGALVLDVDPRHGGDASMSAAISEHGRLPEGPVARTGGGGWHYWFAPLVLAEGEELVRHPLRGTDLCGPGHYVVAPPSVHPETRLEYRWLRRCDLPLPELPDWLRGICVRRPAPARCEVAPGEVASRRAAAWLERVEGAVAGQHGHDATYRVACALVQRFGLPDHEAWPLLVRWNERCQPPWREADLRRKLREARRAA